MAAPTPPRISTSLTDTTPVSEAIRTISVTPFTYYRWRKEFGGLKSTQVNRLKELENASERLREGSVRGRGVNSRIALAGIGVAIGPCG